MASSQEVLTIPPEYDWKAIAEACDGYLKAVQDSTDGDSSAVLYGAIYKLGRAMQPTKPRQVQCPTCHGFYESIDQHFVQSGH